MLQVDQSVSRGIRAADELVQLQLDCPAVFVLAVLNEKHREEGEHGRRGVYDQLPSVGVVKDRPRDRPQQACGGRNHEGGR